MLTSLTFMHIFVFLVILLSGGNTVFVALVICCQIQVIKFVGEFTSELREEFQVKFATLYTKAKKLVMLPLLHVGKDKLPLNSLTGCTLDFDQINLFTLSFYLISFQVYDKNNFHQKLQNCFHITTLTTSCNDVIRVYYGDKCKSVLVPFIFVQSGSFP